MASSSMNVHAGVLLITSVLVIDLGCPHVCCTTRPRPQRHDSAAKHTIRQLLKVAVRSRPVMCPTSQP